MRFMMTCKESRTADEVRAAMARAHATQSTVAERLGLSRQAVSDRLRGRTPWNIREIHELADYLKVPACILVDPDSHRIAS